MKRIPRVFVKDRRKLATAVMMCGIGEALLIGVAAFAMRDAFTSLHTDGDLPMTALIELSLAGVLIAGLRVLNRVMSERLGQHYAVTVRHGLFTHLAGQPLSQIAERRSGAVALRFVGDLGALRNWAGRGLAYVVTAAIVLPGAAWTIWLVNPLLAQSVAVPMVVLIGVMVLGAVALCPIHRSLRSRRAQIAIKMMERARLAPHLDRMRRTRREARDLDGDGEKLSKVATRRIFGLQMLYNLPGMGLSFAGVAIIYTALVNGVPASDVAAALAILAILASPLRDLSSVWDRYVAWRVAREKYEKLMARPSAPRNPHKGLGGVQIDFRFVRFRNIVADFVIDAGAVVLVSGELSTGKSSFLRLAVGLEEPDAGKVVFGKEEISPRAMIIGQDAPIIQGSLRRALTLGAVKRPSDPEIEAAARDFDLGNLLDRLGGLGGRVGEEGRTISESETLRILLTRALLAKPNIIAIDSALIELNPTLKEFLDKLRKETGATLLVSARCRDTVGCYDSTATISETGTVKYTKLPTVSTEQATHPVWQPNVS